MGKVLLLGQGLPKCCFPEPIVTPEPLEGSAICQQAYFLLAHRQLSLIEGHSPWVCISKASDLFPCFILCCSSNSTQGPCPIPRWCSSCASPVVLQIPADIQTDHLPHCSLLPSPVCIVASREPEGEKYYSQSHSLTSKTCFNLAWTAPIPKEAGDLPPPQAFAARLRSVPAAGRGLVSWVPSWSKALKHDTVPGGQGTHPSSLHSLTDPWRWHMGRADWRLPGSLGDNPLELQPSEVTAGWYLGSCSPWAWQAGAF